MNLDSFPKRPFVRLLGQNSILIDIGSTRFLVDPYFSNSVAELDSEDLTRLTPIPYQPNTNLDLDLILISHLHIDHCDPKTIPDLARANPDAKFYGPQVVINKLHAFGISPSRTICATSQPLKFSDLTFIPVPAFHPDLCLGIDNQPTHLGFIVKCLDLSLYIACDTKVTDELINFLLPHSPFSISFLPVNEDNYFRRLRGIIGNMSIRDAFGLAQITKTSTVAPVHWDMFAVNSTCAEEIKAVYKHYDWPFRLTLAQEFSL